MLASAITRPPGPAVGRGPIIPGIDPERIVRLTVNQYAAMIPAGVIAEGAPIELVNGVMRWKNRAAAGESIMTIGKRHAATVIRLHTLLTLLLQDVDCFVQSQSPVSLSEIDEPEPDVCVVSGSIDDERERHPTPNELVVVIEVADSSVADDRSEKLQAYAAAGVSHYWIVNLVAQQIEVYQQPDVDTARYATRVDYKDGETISISLPDGGLLSVDVAQVIR